MRRLGVWLGVVSIVAFVAFAAWMIRRHAIVRAEMALWRISAAERVFREGHDGCSGSFDQLLRSGALDPAEVNVPGYRFHVFNCNDDHLYAVPAWKSLLPALHAQRLVVSAADISRDDPSDAEEYMQIAERWQRRDGTTWREPPDVPESATRAAPPLPPIAPAGEVRPPR